MIGIEACATAHHLGRELIALGCQIRLVPPSDVKADPKRGKNDAADTEAIREAATRPCMRSVLVKSSTYSLFAGDFHRLVLVGFPAHQL